MLEIVSPAGCPEGVIAAVQNGADAVYLGFADYNAQKKAVNFTPDEFGRAAEYCRVRGVKTYITLNSISSNQELPIIAERAKTACQYGVDAIIVQDLGVMLALKRAVPQVPLFAGTQMCIHNLEGAKMAAAMGFKRVTISRELSRRKIAYICKNSPVDIEVIAHGMLCAGYSGQCNLSTMLCKSSDNRGMCDMPCLREFSSVGNAVGHPLSMKDYCLAHYTSDLEKIGVKSIKIAGRIKRPEYTAIVTAIYSKAAQSGRTPKFEELSVLQKVFSRQGFTDGYYTGKLNEDMFADPQEDVSGDSTILTTARKNYLNGEFQRVPVRFAAVIAEGKRSRVGVMDDVGNTAVAYGPIPELAFHKQLTAATIHTQLHKTAGTPFKCVGVKASIAPGLSLKASAFDEMSRSLFEELHAQRKLMTPRIDGDFTPGEYSPGYDSPPILNISITRLSQLSKEIEELRPSIVYIPILEFDFDSKILLDFLNNENIVISAALPRVIHDSEVKKISDTLTLASRHGIEEVLVNNLGQIQFARSHGMSVRGDFGFNVYNSETLRVLRDLRLKSALISFEMKLSDIRNMPKPLDCELVVYGRLPLMITENCIIKNCTGVCACENFSGLRDKNGALLPVLPEYGCRNVVLNSNKLFLADKRKATTSIGLWGERLMFTTENALECAAVLKRYKGIGNYEPSGFTRGVYFSGL